MTDKQMGMKANTGGNFADTPGQSIGDRSCHSGDAVVMEGGNLFTFIVYKKNLVNNKCKQPDPLKKFRVPQSNDLGQPQKLGSAFCKCQPFKFIPDYSLE
jgi:hypothetical protein